MEAKKTQRADLENKRLLFLEIGLAVSLFVVVGAFAAGQGEKKVEKIDMVIAPISEEIILSTQEQNQPEVRTQTVQVLSDFINIVRDDAKISTSMDFTEFSSDFAIEIPEIIEEKVEDIPVFVAEEMPKFQGGDLGAFRTWVQSQLVYPRMAQENNVQGKVIVQFVIEPDGRLTNIEEKASPDKSLTEEVIRVLKSAPKWTPGKQRNKPVRVAMILPIDFVLSN